MDDQNSMDDRNSEETTRDDAFEGLKPEINHLAYSRVPGTMTITKFETLTCKILELFQEVWDEEETK